MYQNMAMMLLVENVDETVTWYRDVLGARFQYGLPKTSPYEWVSLMLDDIEVMICHKKAAQNCYSGKVMVWEKPANVIAYFYVKEANVLYNQIKDKAKIIKEPIDQPHGIREFAVQDPFGFTLTFAQILQ